MALDLAGVNLWVADPASGENVGPPGIPAFEYDNFSATANARIIINGAPNDTTFALTPGAQTFDFSHEDFGDSSPAGLGLWFSDSGAIFSGPLGAPPHLVVYDPPGFKVPGRWVLVNPYGAFVNTAAYSGWSSAVVAGSELQVTQFSYDAASRSGSFTLSIGAPPVPTLGRWGAAMLAATLVSAGLLTSARIRRA
jgi:hypothetical protein